VGGERVVVSLTRQIRDCVRGEGAKAMKGRKVLAFVKGYRSPARLKRDKGKKEGVLPPEFG